MNAIQTFWTGIFSALCLSIEAASPATPVAADPTLFHLVVDVGKGVLVDRTQHFVATVKDAAIERDPQYGACVRLGESGITVADNGTMRFEGGMTLEAWVRLDEPLPEKGAMLALKVGSFAFDLLKGKLNTEWMVFPSEEIFTTTPQQYKYFPVGGDTINGLMPLPTGRWTRLTVSYNEALGVVTTLMDGLVDRRRYRYRGAEKLQSDGKSPLVLFSGCKGMRVAGIKLGNGMPDVLPPTMEAYLNALPYRGQAMLTLDHIDTRLPLPIEVAIIWEMPSGETSSKPAMQKLTLDSHARRDILFDAPAWQGSLHTCIVSAAAAGRQFFSRSLRLSNAKAAGRMMVNADLTLSREGKKFFPLMIYHAMPEHFALMKELGFNLVLNDFNLNRDNHEGAQGYARELARCLDAAQQSGLGLIVGANAAFGKLFTIPVAKDHPALAAWYGDDEPWGDLTRLHESYNTIKLLAPNPPVLIVQNNYSRLQDTAPAADILATDPYPVPNVSLRAVADATLASRRAVADRKPVWTVLPQYGSKVPAREELRCMAWLAIASGANGLGIFTWDERAPDAKTHELKGWFTPEHPGQIEDLRAVLAELTALEEILLAPTAAQQPAFTKANPAVHALLKEAGGKRWLIVANDSRRAEQAELKNEVSKAARRVDTGASTAAGIAFGNGAATLKLDALAVAVFELSPTALSPGQK